MTAKALDPIVHMNPTNSMFSLNPRDARPSHTESTNQFHHFVIIEHIPLPVYSKVRHAQRLNDRMFSWDSRLITVRSHAARSVSLDVNLFILAADMNKK